MRLFLGGTILVASLALIYGYCQDEKDCNKDECCVSMSAHDKKRGYCTKLQAEGESCNMLEEKNHGKFFRACPCRKGLTCTAARGMKELVIGPFAIFVLRCKKTRPTVTTSGTAVSKASGKDGGSDQEEIIYEVIDGGKVIDEEKIIRTIDGKPGSDGKKPKAA